MVDWRLIFKQEYKFLNVPKKPYSPIFIPNVFESDETDLAIQITSRKIKESWKQAGSLTQVLIDFPNQATGDIINVDLGVNKVLNLSDKASRFKLRFDPVKWLENVTISLWRPSVSISQILSTNSVSSVTVVTQKNVTATATSLLTANANRTGLTLYNTGNKTLYVGYDPTVSTASASIVIPAGSIWEFSSPVYTGPVFGIMPATQTATVSVTEFL